MHRTTENSLDLKDASVGVMETTHYRKGKQRCQPTHVREKLVETDSPYRSERPWSYTVTVNGLILRKDGTVGAMPISMTFSDPDSRWDASGGVGDIPADIAALLVGADGLRDWKRPADKS